MFDSGQTPRVFGLAPGVDFPRALLAGIQARLVDEPPETCARLHLIVNTTRMYRRLMRLFAEGPPQLLPRISLITELGGPQEWSHVPPPVPPLRRRLELVQLIGKLLEQQPDLAARASQFDLADSLATLIEEMHGEGVGAQVIRDLDVRDMSGHWARAQAFFAIADHFTTDGSGPDAQEYQRLVVESMIARWRDSPPDHPVILAGSTGSRGTTAMLMQAIARLPQGAVVLPGFDFNQPGSVWAHLGGPEGSEDHPQYRFCALMRALEITASDIPRWHDMPPPCPGRNRLISLSFRPAPVTDAWMKEGPDLGDLTRATDDITLIEAPAPRIEALSIALRLRQAAQDGQTAALITPDRMLTRQVSAALTRWNILADDSAGTPLQLSPPGRFLRHIAGLFGRKLTGETLLTLLKHPLCHDGDGRGEHLRHTRDLELLLRRYGPAFPDAASLKAHGDKANAPPEWTAWLTDCLCDQLVEGELPLGQWVTLLRQLAERLSAGSGASPGTLWDKKAGQGALSVITSLEQEAGHGGEMTARDFTDLLGALLAGEEVRDRDAPHADIMIWGTLEARVQGADLVILGGLNEGSWPEHAPPDPWLNRQMRLAAGLLLPERRIGLSAHDFQQAIGAPEIWLTRSKRSDDADTVASRWLNRLTGLLDGLPGNHGPEALTQMVYRGSKWLEWADSIDRAAPTNPAPRPSPRPPVAARPRKLSVTEIKRLIRDPYAIYAKHVLRLRPLDPLVPEPDTLLRGIAIHEIMEELIRESLNDPAVLSHSGFLALSRVKLAQHVPWPTARALWLARIERISRDFLDSEITRRASDEPIRFEAKGQCDLTGLGFTLTARADRIDRRTDGRLVLIDYKSGTPPTVPQQERFDKQLLLMAAMAEQGGFEGVKPEDVADALFIGLGSKYTEVAAPLDAQPPGIVWDNLCLLIAAYLQPGQGFTARRMLHKDTDRGDYDQLARFGEWDRSTTPRPEDLT